MGTVALAPAASGSPNGNSAVAARTSSRNSVPASVESVNPNGFGLLTLVHRRTPMPPYPRPPGAGNTRISAVAVGRLLEARRLHDAAKRPQRRARRHQARASGPIAFRMAALDPGYSDFSRIACSGADLCERLQARSRCLRKWRAGGAGTRARSETVMQKRPSNMTRPSVLANHPGRHRSLILDNRGLDRIQQLSAERARAIDEVVLVDQISCRAVRQLISASTAPGRDSIRRRRLA